MVQLWVFAVFRLLFSHHLWAALAFDVKSLGCQASTDTTDASRCYGEGEAFCSSCAVSAAKEAILIKLLVISSNEILHFQDTVIFLVIRENPYHMNHRRIFLVYLSMYVCIYIYYFYLFIYFFAILCNPPPRSPSHNFPLNHIKPPAGVPSSEGY
jgi:hypothetical protein